MRAQISLVFTVLFAVQLSAQSKKVLQISGDIAGYSNQIIFLQDYAAHRSRTLDSVKTDAEGHFTFAGIIQPYRGMYRLVLKNNPTEKIDILSTDEKVTIAAKYEFERLSYSFLEGDDNIVWNAYLDKSSEIRLKKQALDEMIQLVYTPNDKFYKQLQKEQLHLEKQAEKNKKNFLKQTSEMSLAREYELFFEFFTDEAIYARCTENCANYWRGINYTSEAAYRTNYLIEQIPYYFADCAAQSQSQNSENESYSNLVDNILEAFVVNKPLYEATIDYLLIGFEQAGNTDLMAYIINKYVVGDGCEIENRYPSITDKIAKNRQLQPGALAQNLVLTNFTNQQVTFNAANAQKQILFFWSSSCPHCMQEIPKLANALAVLQTQNIPVYTVALEIDKNQWRATLEANKLYTYGNHVSELKGWEGSATEIYPILALPAIFIIQDGKIVGKYKSIDEAIQTLLQHK